MREGGREKEEEGRRDGWRKGVESKVLMKCKQQ